MPVVFLALTHVSPCRPQNPNENFALVCVDVLRLAPVLLTTSWTKMSLPSRRYWRKTKCCRRSRAPTPSLSTCKLIPCLIFSVPSVCRRRMMKCRTEGENRCVAVRHRVVPFFFCQRLVEGTVCKGFDGIVVNWELCTPACPVGDSVRTTQKNAYYQHTISLSETVFLFCPSRATVRKRSCWTNAGCIQAWLKFVRFGACSLVLC